MLAVPFEKLSWNLDPNEDDEDRDPSLLLQFLYQEESGEQVTKLLQIYSRQVNA